MTFPERFLVGQSERRLPVEVAAKEDGRGALVRDAFSHSAGKVYRGDTGDIARDHYHRLKVDLELMARASMSRKARA